MEYTKGGTIMKMTEADKSLFLPKLGAPRSDDEYLKDLGLGNHGENYGGVMYFDPNDVPKHDSLIRAVIKND
jgi:hypothetical protein